METRFGTPRRFRGESGAASPNGGFDAEGERAPIYQMSPANASRLPQIGGLRITRSRYRGVEKECGQPVWFAELPLEDLFPDKAGHRRSSADKSFATRRNAEYFRIANVSVDRRKSAHQLCERL
jgi:hypothetical protein